MTLQVVGWAIEFRDLPRDERTGRIKGSCKLVLMALANYAGRSGEDCFPAVATIMDETGLSERGVQYALRDLEEHGTIVRTADPLVRASTISRPDKWPISYDIVAFQRDRGRGARSQSVSQDLDSRGAKSEINSPDRSTESSVDLAPEPVNQNHKSKSKDTDAGASAAPAHTPGDDSAQGSLFDVDVEPAATPASSRLGVDVDSDVDRNETRSPKRHATSVQSLGADGLGRASATPPKPRRRKAAAPADDVGTQRIVRAWVDAYREAGIEPTANKRGQAAREIKALLVAGNDPERVMAAAVAAARAGFATIEQQLARLYAPNGRRPGSTSGYRPYQQTATDEDYLRGAEEIFG